MRLSALLLCRQIDKKLVYIVSILVLMVYSYKDVLKNLALDLVGTFNFEGLLYIVCNFWVAI